MMNTQQGPSKRIRIVLCSAVFAVAVAAPGAGLAADWTSGKAAATGVARLPTGHRA